MEIERKFLIDKEAFPYTDYPHKVLEQGYLSTNPVVRVRKEDEEYYLTYKGKGDALAHEEYNLDLTRESYEHLIKKADGNIITKNRYLIPIDQDLTIELDEFLAPLQVKGVLMAEIEFPSVEAANSFVAPEWFGEEVTYDPYYRNANISKL